MELLSIHINQKENSYFVFLINILSIFHKKVNIFHDKVSFYTDVTIKKRFTFRFRVRSIEYLKETKDTTLKILVYADWFNRLLKLFVLSIDSVYIPVKMSYL